MPESMPSLPPNPCLVAILLVIKTKAGPRVVFHYPPSPSTSSSSSRIDPAWYGNPSTHVEDSDSYSSDWKSSDSDGGQTDEENGTDGSRASGERGSRQERGGGSVRSSKTKIARSNKKDDLEENILEGPRDRTREGDGDDRNRLRGEDTRHRNAFHWHEVLGFRTDSLSKILSPGRAFNKRRFEVCIDQFVCVGAPRFVREDGLWKKRRKGKKRSHPNGVAQHMKDRSERSDNDYVHVDEGIDVTEDEHEGSGTDAEREAGFDAANRDEHGSGPDSGPPSDAGSDARSTSTNGHESEMTMFNIVFVLDPPALEHHIRVREMYDNVVKNFAKALKYEQARSNYVFKESRLILSMKEKAKEQRTPPHSLWPSIIRSSALAKAMVVTFDAISSNKIAHISLSAGFDTSFQIPQATSTPFIPSSFEPQMPGLWLTTASLIDEEDTDRTLSPYSALLLLEDNDVLLKEIESDAKELSGPLSYFIRNLTPTKSLLKCSQTHSMSLKDLQLLARHLIYWRRARAIPPLRPGDTYIVSPNADMRALKTAIPAFAARFPTLPALPKVLQSLSGVPKPYAFLMPSKDHKPAYMEILAWLMRGGWVTQLRTFGWVRVSPEVKAAVAAKMHEEAESLKQEQDATSTANGETEDAISDRLSQSASLRSPENRSITSPRLSAYLSPKGPPSESGSTNSSRTAVPASSPLSPPPPAHQTLRKPSPLHHPPQSAPSGPSSSAAPTASNGPSDAPDPPPPPPPVFDPAAYSATLVHSPQKANALESRWIEHIWAAFAADDGDDELRELWPRFLGYFDGRHALEEIAVREGLKKKRVAAVLARLIAAGCVMTVRHW